jgi:hypothetical protein
MQDLSSLLLHQMTGSVLGINAQSNFWRVPCVTARELQMLITAVLLGEPRCTHCSARQNMEVRLLPGLFICTSPPDPNFVLIDAALPLTLIDIDLTLV